MLDYDYIVSVFDPFRHCIYLNCKRLSVGFNAAFNTQSWMTTAAENTCFIEKWTVDITLSPRQVWLAFLKFEWSFEIYISVLNVANKISESPKNFPRQSLLTE